MVGAEARVIELLVALGGGGGGGRVCFGEHLGFVWAFCFGVLGFVVEGLMGLGWGLEFRVWGLPLRDPP